MKPLRRHQLVWLDEFAWYCVLASASTLHEPARALSTEATDCLAHWAQQDWPLVVTRQAAEAAVDTQDGALALGLAAPACWGRQPISVTASLCGVTRQGEFPLALDLVPQLPAAAQVAWGRLCDRLARLEATARVYGSYGWQQLTGMNYVHEGSDIDLSIDVRTADQADQAAAALLLAIDTGSVRIDGELAFDDGASVAWREWLRFRSGQADQILVKRLAGATLEASAAWASNA